jgi:hypothetical protein
MTIEAMQAFGWKSAGIALRLRNHPTQVQTLQRFRQAVQEIPLFGLRILTIDPAWLDLAAGISQQTGLLHNDALMVAVMRAVGLTNLARGKKRCQDPLSAGALRGRPLGRSVLSRPSRRATRSAHSSSPYG